MKNTEIDINIWDDYYEEGHIPEGKIQETYIYVESDQNIPEQGLILDYLLDVINHNIDKGIIDYLDGVKMWLELFDSRKKYPHCTPEYCEERIGVPYDKFHYQRYQIQVEHMTHEMRERLVEDLKKSNLSYDNIPFVIYSES